MPLQTSDFVSSRFFFYCIDCDLGVVREGTLDYKLHNDFNLLKE